MGHSVSEQGTKAGQKGQATAKKEALTAARAITEIRSLRASGLAVLNVEYVDLLLLEYDNVKSLLSQNTEVVQTGTKTLELLGQELDQAKVQLKNAKEQIERWQDEFSKMVTIRDGFLAERDDLAEKLKTANDQTVKLTEENEQFRKVYEIENSHSTLTVERSTETATQGEATGIDGVLSNVPALSVLDNPANVALNDPD